MLNVLTAQEQKYFNIMKAKSGVLYITAKPGVGKSAILKGIAKKKNYKYIDLRLSTIDETDLGSYPSLKNVDGDDFLFHVTPLWAKKANEQPTIIHFEELNRASLSVRNAALQMLLERTMGTDFEFNDNVLMVASGNLGETDGTDVEEFDAALKNRLVHIPHNLTAEEWITNYAEANINASIVSYIKVHPEELYPIPGENASAFASNRTWTFFSDYIKSTYGANANSVDVLEAANEVGTGYVGPSILKFKRYIESIIHISIKDILNNFGDVKEEVRKSDRSKFSELLHELKQLNIEKLKVKEINNVIEFLKLVTEDELVGYLIHLSDNSANSTNANSNMIKILKPFKTTFEEITKLNNLEKAKVKSKSSKTKK